MGMPMNISPTTSRTRVLAPCIALDTGLSFGLGKFAVAASATPAALAVHFFAKAETYLADRRLSASAPAVSAAKIQKESCIVATKRAGSDSTGAWPRL